CLAEFDSDGDHPPCPNCGGLRVKWLPRPVAIGKVAGGIDRDVRELADTYGMSDIRSPQRDRAAVVTAPSVGQPAAGLPFQPTQGWGMNLPAQALMGNGSSVCSPVKFGALPPASQKVTGPQWKPREPTPVLEASHRPEEGLPNG